MKKGDRGDWVSILVPNLDLMNKGLRLSAAFLRVKSLFNVPNLDLMNKGLRHWSNALMNNNIVAKKFQT